MVHWIPIKFILNKDKRHMENSGKEGDLELTEEIDKEPSPHESKGSSKPSSQIAKGKSSNNR